jgi:ketosteroid isomerase-like protein
MMQALRYFLPVPLLLTAACADRPDAVAPEALIAKERAALDRWGKGDPGGYLSIYDPDVTYFDPMRDARADGLPAMQAYLAPFAGKVKIDRYEMINPKVQARKSVAVLSYQFVSHGTAPSGVPVEARWNSTKVYALAGEEWKIIHDHWSFIRPELKQPVP